MQSVCVVFGLKQEVQEVYSFVAEDSFVAQAREANQLCESVCRHFTIQSLTVFAHLIEEAAQDADAVQFLVGVARLLDLCEVSDSIAVVFDDTVKESECPSDERGIAAHLVDNGKKRAEQGHHGLCIASLIEECSLVFMAEILELPNSLAALSWQLIGGHVSLDGVVVDPVVEDFTTNSWLLICEDAGVHEDLVGDLLTLVAGTAFNHL